MSSLCCWEAFIVECVDTPCCNLLNFFECLIWISRREKCLFQKWILFYNPEFIKNYKIFESATSITNDWSWSSLSFKVMRWWDYFCRKSYSWHFFSFLSADYQQLPIDVSNLYLESTLRHCGFSLVCMFVQIALFNIWKLIKIDLVTKQRQILQNMTELTS